MIFTNPLEIVKIRLQVAGVMTGLVQLVLLRSYTSLAYTRYVHMYICV